MQLKKMQKKLNRCGHTSPVNATKTAVKLHLALNQVRDTMDAAMRNAVKKGIAQ